MPQNSQIQSIAFTNSSGGAEINAAFVLRLTCDVNTLNWRILLRSANPEETRIFTNLESAFLYLEAWMANQILPFNEEPQSQ